MTSSKVKIVLSIINDHFGELVEDISNQLILNGPLNLKAICFFSKKPIHLVKECLKILIQHNLVEYELNNRDQIEYKLLSDNVISILRYSKYNLIATNLDNKFGEYLIDELIKNGKITLDDLIEKLVKKLSNLIIFKDKYQLPKLIYDVFVKFVNQEFIINKDKNKTIPIIDFKKYHSLVNVKKEQGNLDDTEDDELEERPIKKQKTTDDHIENNQQQIYWFINNEQFDNYLRGDLILELIKSFYDDSKAGELARLIYLHSDKDGTMSRNQIVNKSIDLDICDNSNEVDIYLKLFNQDLDNRFIYRVESTSDGGRYFVNTNNLFNYLIKETLSTIVNNCYGDKSSRIFRLLLIKKYLQQKQIGEMAMISVKDAKERLSTLFKDGLVKILQFTKAPDYAPMKTSFVVTVDIKELCFMFRNRCYHSLYSIISKRNHEFKQNRSLIEKKILIDTVIENLKLSNNDQSIHELDQTFSTHEQKILDNYDKITRKIELCELEVERTLFLIDNYLTICDPK